jgi:transcriptional regulator with XRE-family HTH domain
MTLTEWMSVEGKTHQETADLIGIHTSMVTRLCRGNRTPSAALMAKIAQATRGAVMPNDWVPDLEVSVPIEKSCGSVWKASEAASEELHQLYERGRKAGLTGKELAERLGTAESTFFRWLSGKNKIRMQNFRRLEEIVSEAEQGQGHSQQSINAYTRPSQAGVVTVDVDRMAVDLITVMKAAGVAKDTFMSKIGAMFDEVEVSVRISGRAKN